MVKLLLYSFKVLLFASALGALCIHFLLAPLSKGVLLVVYITIAITLLLNAYNAFNLKHNKLE